MRAVVVLDLQSIEKWPVSIYDFTGNGAAAVTPAAYEIGIGNPRVARGDGGRESVVGRRHQRALRRRAAGFPCDFHQR